MTVPIFFFGIKKKIKDFIAQKKEDAVHRKYILKKTETERKEKEQLETTATSQQKRHLYIV